MKPRYEMVSSDVDCVLIRDIGPWDRHLSVTAMVSVVSCLCGTVKESAAVPTNHSINPIVEHQ